MNTYVAMFAVLMSAGTQAQVPSGPKISHLGEITIYDYGEKIEPPTWHSHFAESVPLKRPDVNFGSSRRAFDVTSKRQENTSEETNRTSEDSGINSATSIKPASSIPRWQSDPLIVQAYVDPKKLLINFSGYELYGPALRQGITIGCLEGKGAAIPLLEALGHSKTEQYCDKYLTLVEENIPEVVYMIAEEAYERRMYTNKYYKIVTGKISSITKFMHND